MFHRSFRWSAFGALTFFALVFASAVALAVVCVFMIRNPATGGIWALFYSPLYALAFWVIAEMVSIVIIFWRILFPRLGWRARVATSVASGALGGIAIGLVFWWCIEFEAAPWWWLLLAVIATAGAYGYYVWRYEVVARR